MRRTFSVLALGILFFVLVTPAQSATYDIDAAHSSVSFKIKHLVSNVRGNFGSFSGTLDFDEEKKTGTVSATIDAHSIDTQNENRDTHLRTPDFFAVEKFPDIAFTGATTDGSALVGELTLHGVAKEVTLELVYHGSASDPKGVERVGFTAKTTINRKEFGMEYNKVLDQGGLLLGETVDIEIEIEAVQKQNE